MNQNISSPKSSPTPPLAKPVTNKPSKTTTTIFFSQTSGSASGPATTTTTTTTSNTTSAVPIAPSPVPSTISMLSILSPPLTPFSRLASIIPPTPAASVQSGSDGIPESSSNISTAQSPRINALKRLAGPSLDRSAAALKRVKLAQSLSNLGPQPQTQSLAQQTMAGSASENTRYNLPIQPKTFVPPSATKQVPRNSEKSSSRTPASQGTTSFSAYQLESFNPAAPLVGCCWESLKADPAAYLKLERKFLALYKRHSPSSRNYVVTAHSRVKKTKSSILPVATPPRARRNAGPSRTPSNYNSSESDNMTTRSRMSTTRVVPTSTQFSGIPPISVPVATVTTPISIPFILSPSIPHQTQLDSIVEPKTLANSIPPPSSPSPRKTPAPKPRKPRAPRKPRVGTPNGANTNSQGAPSFRIHDLNSAELLDFSPPVDSLPPGKTLKTEWKGSPMDLTNDPKFHLLHPAEVPLAAVLRLPADVYIDSKKRLFAEKVNRLKQGLPFRRTDSQKACRIDVNKASRLFTAYEKVGWLEDSLFEKYL